MTSLVGWAIIIVTFALISMGLLYPGYRVARRSYPGSRNIWWIYGIATAVCGIALWLLLPLVFQRFFGRFGP
jgi:hypothetical protein